MGHIDGALEFQYCRLNGLSTDMKVDAQINRCRLWERMILLVALCSLTPCRSAMATAPRVAQPLFGTDSQADVVGHQAISAGSRTKAEEKLIITLVTESFQAGGMLPVIDLLPSKQLAHYEFIVNEVPALIIEEHDMPAQHMEWSHKVVFYVKGGADGADAVSVIFSKKNPRARELHRVFDKGLRAIIENGRYVEVVKQYPGIEGGQAGMLGRLKHLNPGWK